MLVALVAFTALAACGVPGFRGACTAGRFDASFVGPASTADGALQLFLQSLDAAGMPSAGWQRVSTAANAVSFRSGAYEATAVHNPGGWGVIAYTTCAT